jgi:cytochrome c-type biogenesis protein CcmE
MARSNLLKILVSALIIVGAASYLLADTLFADPDVLTYMHGADSVITNPKDFSGRRIRVGGLVADGSIHQKPGTLDYYFEVTPIDRPGLLIFKEALGKKMGVRYTGVVPDTFKEGNEVSVTGKLADDGTFVATEMAAKCPSKYEAEAKNKGEY